MSDKAFPAVLLIGDPFLIEEKIKELLAGNRQQDRQEVPRQIYYLSDTLLDSILIHARTLPFFSAHQIFIIRDLQKLKKVDFSLLENYLDRPFEGTTLFFEATNPAKLEEMVKLFERKGQVYVLKHSDRAKIEQFIQSKVKQTGKVISQKAVQELQERAGDSPSFLDSILERLILYAGSHREINDEMVQTFEEDWTQDDIFKITNAIAERNVARGLRLLREAMDQNEKDIVGLIGILHWQIRRLWLARALLDSGLSQNEILKKCHISYKQATFFWRQLQGFNKTKLEKALEGIFQLDWKLKTGRVDGPVALESWLIEVAG